MDTPQNTLDDLAGRVRYIGSPEHKDVPSFVGRSRPRADASICPRELNESRDLVEDWLREAVRDGDVGAPWEGEFPRYVWYRDESGRVFEGRLVNRGLGDYKGYPLMPDEYPEHMSDKSK